jgi:hypothetical protein
MTTRAGFIDFFTQFQVDCRRLPLGFGASTEDLAQQKENRGIL